MLRILLYLLLLSALSITPAKAQVLERLADLMENPRGQPLPGLVLGNDGNIYGATLGGGTSEAGVLFRVKRDGTFEVAGGLSFPGLSANSQLVQGADGFFYSNSSLGLWRIALDGALIGVGSSEGEPGRVIQAADGFFYFSSGKSIFRSKLLTHPYQSTDAGAIVTLQAPSIGFLNDGLVEGDDGALYVTTRDGGTNGCGMFLRVTLEGAVTKLADFAPATGANPVGPLVLGADGNFYGATTAGGSSGHGVIFKMTPQGSQSVIAAFPQSPTKAALAWGNDGALYGTTIGGGSFGAGTIFRVGIEGSYLTLHHFSEFYHTIDNSDRGGLTLGADGCLYGTTVLGLGGSLFRIDSQGLFSTVQTFAEASGNVAFDDGVIEGGDGNFYGLVTGNLFQRIVRISPTGTVTSVAQATFNAGNHRPWIQLLVGGDGLIYAQGEFLTFRLTPEGQLVEFIGLSESPSDTEHNGIVNIYCFDQEVYALRADGNSELFTTVDLPGSLSSDLRRGSDGSWVGLFFESNVSKGHIFRLGADGTVTPGPSFTAPTIAAPYGEVVEGTGGNFYLTATRKNGEYALFGINSAGAVSLMSTSLASVFSMPGFGRLTRRPDGTIVGTMESGDGFSLGTAFTISPEGVFTKTAEFPTDGRLRYLAPGATLGSDGNFYKCAGSEVFRLVWPGPPLAGDIQFSAADTSSTSFSARVNARGAITSTILEYGTDGVVFPFSAATTPSLNLGYASKTIGGKIDQLQSGQTYYCRLRATSSAGTKLSQVESFRTLSIPQVSIGQASEINSTSARFHGTINARNLVSNGSFEWGVDGNNFPNRVPAFPEEVAGDMDIPVSAVVAGLPEGGTIFFRLRATNAGGSAVSGVSSFSTVSVTTTAAAQVGVSDATFKATINTFGRTASVKFKYWADSAPGLIFETSAQTVTTGGPMEVSAKVTGLQENVTYRYQVTVDISGTKTDGAAVPMTTAQNLAPVAVNDYFFYAGQVVIDPLNGETGDYDANDLDLNGQPGNFRLKIRPTLLPPVVPDQTTYLDKARVTQDGRLITYNAGDAQPENEYFRYQVEDPFGAVATARVHLIHFRTRAGLYTSGLKVKTAANAAAQDRGDAIAFQLSRTGSGTGRVFWEGARYPLGGNFDERGVLLREPAKEGDPTRKLVVRLALPEAGGNKRSVRGRIEETVTATGEVMVASDFVAPLDTLSVVRPGQLNGFLTQVGGVGETPEGYLLFTIQDIPTRRARFVGRLPGTPAFSGQTGLSQFSYALNVPIGKKGRDGILGGAVNIVQNTDGAKPAAMVGTLTLTKPAGEELPLTLDGTQWRAAAKGMPVPLSGDPTTLQYNATLHLSGGDLASAVDAALVITSRGVQVGALTPAIPGAALPGKLKLSLNAKTGALSGSFIHPVTGAKAQIDGALIPAFGSAPGSGRGGFRPSLAPGRVWLAVP